MIRDVFTEMMLNLIFKDKARHANKDRERYSMGKEQHLLSHEGMPRNGAVHSGKNQELSMIKNTLQRQT